MIIKDIQLTNFGKFNHKMVSFKPGVNIIYGENEAGKTTLHTFIRGMLFGIEKQRGKASSKDVYTKYEPWDNPANYQGMMRIESDGVNYRIERNFNKEHKMFKVIDEDNGRELTETEISRLFEGLDESCYYNTISISQLGSVTDKELETILKNYAANLGTTKSMEIDIKEAYMDLDSQRKKIAAENKINEEDIIVREIKNETDKLDISEREQHTIIASIEQKKESMMKLLERKKELSALDAKRLEELAKQNERKDNLYQDVIAFTADSEKYAVALEKIQNHKNDLDNQLKSKGIDSKETMDWLTDKIVNRSNMPAVFIILMMACIGSGVGYVLGNQNLMHIREFWIKPAICAGASVLFLILSIIRYFAKKRKKASKLEMLKELKLVMDKLEASKHEEVYVKRQLDNKREALQRSQEMLKNEEARHLDTDDYSEELKKLEAQEREINDAISKSQWILEQKQEHDIELQKNIETLNHRHEQIKLAKIEILAIEEAKKNIEEIANEIRNSFGRKLNERASYYMANITNGKYDSLTIDEHLNISINSKHALITASKLSKGTIEQIYMALRLAAADIIFEKDKKPILLDDAFVMYDNKRMGNTMKFMAENMGQVIIFSCHTREKVMADRLGIEYNFIRL